MLDLRRKAKFKVQGHCYTFLDCLDCSKVVCGEVTYIRHGKVRIKVHSSAFHGCSTVMGARQPLSSIHTISFYRHREHTNILSKSEILSVIQTISLVLNTKPSALRARDL